MSCCPKGASPQDWGTMHQRPHDIVEKEGGSSKYWEQLPNITDRDDAHGV